MMHVIQAMTSVHDRYLSQSSPRQTSIETYHLSEAAALFNKQLSGTIKTFDKDAIWATAASKSILVQKLLCLSPSGSSF